jgi:sulfoacetaldehyde acetyltransferase
MGALGIRVEDADQIGPALKKAFAADRAAVIDLLVDPKVLSEPYRRDALKLPERVLPRYRN